VSLPLRTRMGIFGRTYGLMLAAVLGAEVLIFSAMVMLPPPLPPFVDFTRVVAMLEGRNNLPPPMSLDIAITAREPVQGRDRSSLALARALARELKLSPDALRVDLGRFGPPRPLGPLPLERIAADQVPSVIAGEFTAARRLPDGRWLTVANNTDFLGEAALRIGLLLLGTLGLVLPAAYLLARHSVRPIERFATAAERLGRDPQAPPMAEEGPEEIRIASEAFNRMQRRLSSYIEERTTMVAAVAHDLRTPLMRMAFEIEDAPAPLHDALTAQIREMREMTDAIMRFLHAEQSRHQRDLVVLDALLAEVAEGFVAEGAAVRWAAQASNVAMIGDPVGLKSVLRNVIGNAVTYGRLADVVLIADDHRVTITVSDDGPGLSPEDLQRVFQPFYRVEKSRNRATGGVGLGLAVARSIIVAHGGEITLANRAEGGLEARIVLPMAQASA